MILNASLRENIIYGNNNDIQDLSIKKYIKDFQVFKENENIDLDRPISNKSLSMGQMQKISYIRALVSGIDILILDESTSNLDNDSKSLIYNILSEKKLTIINSTHNPEDFKDYDFHIQINEGSSSRKISIKKND